MVHQQIKNVRVLFTCIKYVIGVRVPRDIRILIFQHCYPRLTCKKVIPQSVMVYYRQTKAIKNNDLAEYLNLLNLFGGFYTVVKNLPDNFRDEFMKHVRKHRIKTTSFYEHVFKHHHYHHVNKLSDNETLSIMLFTGMDDYILNNLSIGDLEKGNYMLNNYWYNGNSPKVLLLMLQLYISGGVCKLFPTFTIVVHTVSLLKFIIDNIDKFPRDNFTFDFSYFRTSNKKMRKLWMNYPRDPMLWNFINNLTD